jgi:hypothetical protein
VAKRKFPCRAIPLPVGEDEQRADVIKREAEFPASTDKRQTLYVVRVVDAMPAVSARRADNSSTRS